jgi:subtilisin-like proprotein convertase family protein
VSNRSTGRTARHAIGGALAALTLVAALLGWAIPASAAVFSNSGAITIPAAGTTGIATPYPSTISVAATGPVTDVNATLTGFTHTFIPDVDVLLVGPAGQSVVLMADPDNSGSAPFAVTGLNLTFDDAASAPLPPATLPTSGTYKPTIGTAGAFNGPAPAPAAPYGTTLSVFNGTSASGTWKFFVYDDASGDIGTISSGWSLSITTLAITSVPAPASVGDVVVITGTGFTGATSVKFGAISAVTFTVDSDTQITATVPAGASTGPISVTVPAGTASSTADFIVKHARHISLTLTARKGKGTVDAIDGFAPCTTNVPVKVQHLKHHKWRTVAGVLTHADGSFTAVGLLDPGKYRAVAKKTTLSTGDVCMKVISPVAKK